MRFNLGCFANQKNTYICLNQKINQNEKNITIVYFFVVSV